VKNHEDIIDRVAAANPVPDLGMITDGQLAELMLQVEQGRTASTRTGESSIEAQERPASGRASRGPRSRWLKPAAAFAAALVAVLAVLGIVGLLRPDPAAVVDEPAPSLTTVPSVTSTMAPETATAPVAPPPGASTASSDRTNRIRSLAVAGDGSLWAATADGVVRWDLDTQTPTIYTTDHGLPSGGAAFVETGPDGNVWAGGDGWMARFDGALTTIPVPNEYPFYPVAVGPDGTVWAAFGSGTLGRFNGSEWQMLDAPAFAESQGEWAFEIAVAPDGIVWVGLSAESMGDPESSNVSRGVASFDGSAWTVYTTADGLPPQVGNLIAVAPDGTVWAGSAGSVGSDGASVSGGGAASFDGTVWTSYTSADGLPSNDVDVVIGADGSVWAINVYGDGVARFDGTTWILLPDVKGFGVVDADGTFWAPSDEAGGGVVGYNRGQTTRLVVPVDESTAVTSATTIVPAAGEWNPILATTRAGPAAVAATCPTGADPNGAGLVNQERPAPGWAGLLAGAFDNRTGRIVYLDEARETWTFDVCTNTWQQMSPAGAVTGDRSGGLVYDVDSDVTVALGFGHISVYDANDNTWVQQDPSGPYSPMSAVYDPVSGLIVIAELTDSYVDAWAYDVDTNTWTLIGRLWDGGEDYVWFELLGYSREADRLIFTSVDNLTALVDPRTGTRTIIETVTPAIDLAWPGAQYGQAADTTFVEEGVWLSGGMFDDQFPDQICGFDIDTSTWTLCFPMPGGSKYAAFAAMVGDPINDRLVVVHGVYGDFWGLSDDGVWAVALDTGETIELLTPTQRRERTGPS
jgi:hypothetical protein